MADYVMTIESDSEDERPKNKKQKTQDTALDGQLDPDFVFDISGDPYLDFATASVDSVTAGSKPTPISVDDIIARRKRKPKRELVEDSDNEDDASEDNDDSWGGIQDGNESDDPLASSDEEQEDLENHSDSNDAEDPPDGGSSGSDSGSDSEDENDLEDEEEERKAAFFDSEDIGTETHKSFLTMNLSRPLLKALTTLNFSKPTPIQAATIPVALLGKDIVGNAVTGSGKTAAFIIPMIERLLYREKGKKAAATRCLILVPTRELAVQCYDVGTKLAAHTDIRLCLIVGGLSSKAQETALRERPDIVIATPGRLIDHIHNAASFTLDALDILVLDEADRMLSEGFADELAEIVKSCPISRQTMLFSATMTDSVDELVRMSLNKPARLFVDPKRSTARGLIQEFIRVRAEKEADRSAILVTLCKRTFKTKTIVFLRSKKLAHQLRIVFGLCGMKCGELHGDLSQEQRLQSLQQFRDGTIDYLMATDLASRGLDIKGIETVVNYDMPSDLAQYLHRVGRTARAGEQGRSVTLVGEGDRKMLKAAIKHAAAEDQVRHRIVPTEAVSKWVLRLNDMKDEVAEVMKEEKEEKELARAEMELQKGQNMMDHQAEIFSRPARTWFQSGKEKAEAQALSKKQYETGNSAAGSKRKAGHDEVETIKRDKFSGLSRKAKRRKLALEEDANDKATDAAIRSAKRANRPAKIGIPEPIRAKGKTRSKKKQKVLRSGGAFGKDLGQKGKAGEGTRAKRTDAVKGLSKKGPKRTKK
ncbi:DEAD-domain-containing protein [Flagelloscypha sp. PMI_526]|nr:DEAD-domain-containing protein [Flagelloscypha sp. PMI_526]